MLFTWSTHNLCIVFRQWRITGTVSLLLSLGAIVLLTAGYECVRGISRQYEQSHSAQMSAFSSSASSMSNFFFATPYYACIKLKLARRSCSTK
jgi:solute carrier family 31 (copper transporter), member 1